ncbi:alpha-mannosidase [soil metagenome]
MLTHSKILLKLEQAAKQYQKLRFESLLEVPMEIAETREHFRREPGKADKLSWKSIAKGGHWGGDGITGWLRGDFKMPKALAGRRIFLHYNVRWEALAIVDADYVGVFNDKHPFILIAAKATSGKRHHVALESYSGHSFPSTMPHDEPIIVAKKSQIFEGVFLAEERQDVSAFCYDLEVLLKLVKTLDGNSLRKGAITRGLQEVWAAIASLPAEQSEDVWRPALARARKLMAPLLAKKNGDTTPSVALVAHSHIDTAWLWTVAETRRKCARTFSSMANLMKQYPEVIFLQSAPCHADMVRQDYPEIFAKVKALVKAGRWEPNGGCWVEPDCNLTGGEALIRQFLVGINWTREHYGYSPDTLWQPDVFGYSAALPQILLGCGIKYFCTTKMAWNDTTRFPYDTFEWQGIDGSVVLTHLNSLPQFVEADEIVNLWNWAQHKDSEEKRLASYGWGDGGGGPTMEDMEKVRRLENLEGAPKTYYTTVSNFMQDIEINAPAKWPRWVGELYLELHRGTLTSVAGIKRGNRKAELAMRDAEFMCTYAAVHGAEYPKAELLALWKELLVNQFHDILPGTSIAEANDVALASFAKLIREAEALTRTAAGVFAGESDAQTNRYILFNSLGWDRSNCLAVENPPRGMRIKGPGSSQEITDLNGVRKLFVLGPVVPALGSVVVELTRGKQPDERTFAYDGKTLQTPHGVIRFDKAGRIVSYYLHLARREAVAEGGALNTFLLGEDIPYLWDQWDVDSDQELRMQEDMRLVSREVVADGPLQFRLRSEYRIGENSTLLQDMIFHASLTRIDFETKVDWREKHRLLKVGFQVDVMAESARHEIQFGHATRPTHRNYPQDRARFEVCCHKWVDLSDDGFGVAILNDCKYGVGVNGNEIRLSLLKSGTHPDERGDNGEHQFTYSILPHDLGFSVQSVVRPAYELNIPAIAAPAAAVAAPLESLFTIEGMDVIVEAVKWAEKDRAIVIRIYEAGHRAGSVSLRLNTKFSRAAETNLLEEETAPLPAKNGIVKMFVRPFEIRTVKFWIK